MVKAQDIEGSIAFIASVLAFEEVNIATMTVSRKGKHDLACQFIEMDEEVRPLTRKYLKSLKWVKDVIYIPVIGGA
jgi:L-serine dehydratase